MYMEFKNYIGKTILGWLFYHYNDSFEESYGNKCYVYPRILVTGEKYQIINPNDFPQSGRILVRIQGGESAEEVYKRFGSLVSIRINAEPYPNYNSNNVYSMKYSYQHGRTSSEIWIERFDGKGFYQVVDTDSEITTIRKERSLKKPDFELSANFVMLRHGSKLYGPFEYEIKEEEMNLFAARSNQYFVGEYDAIAYNDELCVVTDQNGKEAVLLLPKATVSAPLECTNYYDWIRDETLIDGFMEALRSGNEYTKDAIFDSKFSPRKVIREYGLPEIIRKYSCEIATQEGTPPKMIWALQGRVDSREKPIWKYHNAPLASRYIPQTSYGIISVNTMQGENDFLWDELKRNIPWLA